MYLKKYSIEIDDIQPNETDSTTPVTIHCVNDTPDRCGGYLEVDNEGYEWVRAHYFIGGGAAVCDLTVVLKINGNVVTDVTFEDHETFGQWDDVSHHPSSISSTDTFDMILSFDNCYIDV